MYTHVRDYIERDIYPFHMPGHKRNTLFFLPDIMRYDITEIPGMDTLHEPSGFLCTWQGELASFFCPGDAGAESFFLVNGASAGVVAAICALCREGDVLFMPRNAHASAYHALALSGAQPRYYLPPLRRDATAGSVDPALFDAIPPGAVALVVSPTYEGCVSDIAEIARRVHARGGTLLVDEAHGAHFAFHRSFPRSALACGADIVVHSLHKTLPVPGQCAVLHVRGTVADRGRVRFYINAMQTTSPSYMLMAAADYALRILWENPALFDEYAARLARLDAAPPRATDPHITDPHIADAHTFAADCGKRLYYVLDPAIQAEEMAEIWARRYKIQVEMARGRTLLAMTSVADTDEGFARLAQALKNTAVSAVCPAPAPAPFSLPEYVLTPREALRREAQTIPAAEAIGRIAAELVAPCPPGIAVAAPGERITADLIPLRRYVRVVAEK